MYCKFYIHCSSAEQIAALLEKEFDEPTKKQSRRCFKQFDVILDNNKETDANKMRTYPDGFLYYELTADIEIYEDHLHITDRILKILWEADIPAVVSCDYEEELNRYIFSL